MVPKIQSTVDAREQKIADDLERAQAARAGGRRDRSGVARADGRRARRSRAACPGGEAGQRQRDRGEGPAPPPTRSTLKVEAAEAKIRAAVDAARAEIEAVAAEATQDMVARLTGIEVDQKEAAEAVKAELNG